MVPLGLLSSGCQLGRGSELGSGFDCTGTLEEFSGWLDSEEDGSELEEDGSELEELGVEEDGSELGSEEGCEDDSEELEGSSELDDAPPDDSGVLSSLEVAGGSSVSVVGKI